MKYLLILLLWSATFGIQGSTPILERLVTVNVREKSTGDVFQELERQGDFSFSYKSSLIDTNRPVTLNLKGHPVREALRMILGTGIKYREHGNILILTKATESENKMIMDGYVEDESGQPVADATVFDRTSLSSANTNSYGYYRMRINRTMEPLQLQVSKNDYRDTLRPVALDSARLYNLVIHEEPRDSSFLGTLRSIADTTGKRFSAFADSAGRHIGILADTTGKRLHDLGKELWPDKLELKNVKDTLHRVFQLSFVPFVGTNGDLCGSVINGWSLNVIGGYSFGTEKAEVAGVFNINRSDVGQAQMAGLFNSTAGNVEGFQASGLMNYVGGTVHGAQLSGFANVNRTTSGGFLGSGFVNVSGAEMDGTAVAGFANVVAKNSSGFQAAGFTNVVSGGMNGVQVAGFANVVSADVRGMQIAGFCNYAHNVHGSQLATFNYCDSLTGIPIGVFSFVKHGYHGIEISSGDIFHANVAVRSGVRSFYNIVTAGVQASDPMQDWFRHPVWTYGYGIGTSPKLANWLYLNVDLTCNYIAQRSVLHLGEVSIEQDAFEAFNLDNQLFLGAEVQVAKHLAINGGPVLHGYITERNVTYPDFFANGEPRFIEEYTWNRHIMQMWIGWKVGLRVF